MVVSSTVNIAKDSFGSVNSVEESVLQETIPRILISIKGMSQPRQITNLKNFPLYGLDNLLATNSSKPLPELTSRVMCRLHTASVYTEDFLFRATTRQSRFPTETGYQPLRYTLFAATVSFCCCDLSWAIAAVPLWTVFVRASTAYGHQLHRVSSYCPCFPYSFPF